MTRDERRYVVVCADYTTRPYKGEAAALAELERIEKARYCKLAHEIVEVVPNATHTDRH